MENKIKIFENEEFGSMRTLEENDKVFFCGKDAAAALGYRDTVNALKAHCKEDGVVIHHLIDSMGRLETRETFGSTWLTDYVDNRLNGFISEQTAEPVPAGDYEETEDFEMKLSQ